MNSIIVVDIVHPILP